MRNLMRSTSNVHQGRSPHFGDLAVFLGKSLSFFRVGAGHLIQRIRGQHANRQVNSMNTILDFVADYAPVSLL
jgi:hypothetical protein